jgi:hypothetical protein
MFLHPRNRHLVDSDDGGTGGVKNGIGPRIDMPGQSSLRNVINVRVETEIGLAIKVELVPSHENVRRLPELSVSKADTFAVLELGLIPRSHILRIDRGAKDVLAVFGIGDPAYLRGIKGRVRPRLNVEREAVYIDVGGGCLETPIFAAIEIEEIEENDDFGRGNERALKVDAHGGGGCGVRIQVAVVLAGQELQVGRSKIERVNDAAVKNGVGPRGDMVDTRSFGDVLDRRFDTNVGFSVFIELTDPMGKTRRGDEWTREGDLTIGVRLRLVPRADTLGVKLADGRHCALQEVWRATLS